MRADDVYVTDNSGAWGRQIAVGLAGLAVLASATVVAVVHTADPAAADTFLTSARNAVVTVNGKDVEAVVGQRVPNGAQVRTGQQGGAELVSSGRTVYLGALTTVDVLDGVREKLSRGQVMVDARKGPRLALTTRAGEVRTTAGTLARVETATVLRLAVFDGAAGITAAGRQTTTAVPGLHQVQVPYGFLPGGVTPLALTDDRWETRLASALVSADQDLTHLASSLGGTEGVALLNAAPAALRSCDTGASAQPTTAAQPTGAGERALAVALAQAAGPSCTNLSTVTTARSDGGSWGVVAALVNARVTSVSHLLDLALTPLQPAPPALQAAPAATSIPAILTPQPTLTPSTPTTSVPRLVAKPTKKPVATHTTPPPTQDPGLVGGLVNTVLGLLKPSPTPAPVAARPGATPTPSKLLGLLPLGK